MPPIFWKRNGLQVSYVRGGWGLPELPAYAGCCTGDACCATNEGTWYSLHGGTGSAVARPHPLCLGAHILLCCARNVCATVRKCCNRTALAKGGQQCRRRLNSTFKKQ